MHTIANLCKWSFILLNVGVSWSWISKTIEYAKYNTTGTEVDLFSCEFESYTIKSSCGCTMHVQSKAYAPLAQDTWCSNKVTDEKFIYMERKSVMINPLMTTRHSDLTYFGYTPVCMNPGAMAGISFTPRDNWTIIQFEFLNKEFELLMQMLLNNSDKTVSFKNKYASGYGPGFPFTTDETHLIEVEILQDSVITYVNGSLYNEYWRRMKDNVTPVSLEIIFKDVPGDLHHITYRKAEDTLNV